MAAGSGIANRREPEAGRELCAAKAQPTVQTMTTPSHHCGPSRENVVLKREGLIQSSDGTRGTLHKDLRSAAPGASVGVACALSQATLLLAMEQTARSIGLLCERITV
ncbi:hypothetical protein M8818_006119 [Zalaria obscura]|uniref:Uncharacterized protein n=1 Tax=Zalaria obscura TaxID=2024903 RepID=A0ACC3S7E8_9PEZI